ncbi:hypothetical protein N8653_05990 [Euryarchaeota archaeon]|nr:hypothetical protein [Euryarchaeota archaeon]
MIGELLFDWVTDFILDMIPKRIRKVAGIILIIIGIVISLIAIPFSLLIGAEDTDAGLLIAIILAIPIVFSFLAGFVLILSTKDNRSMRII